MPTRLLPAIPLGCEPACPGCAHRGLSREESERAKQAWLGSPRALGAWAERMRPLRSPELRWGYREKVTLHAEGSSSGWAFGFLVRQKGRRQDWPLIAIPDCPLHSERVRRLTRFLSSQRLPAPSALPLVYLQASGSLATLVVKARSLPAGVRAALAELGPGIGRLGYTGLYLCLNPSAGRRVLNAKALELIWGAPTSRQLGLAHGPASFLQAIPELQTEALNEARDFLAPAPGDFVLDLCSGIGVSLRLWREAGAEALGVELSGEAVGCALKNAGEGSCLRGKCSERIPQLDERVRAWRASCPRGRLLAYVNPPRLGLEPEVAQWLSRDARPDRLAYLSCSAGTLARDLRLLEGAGHLLVSIQPYDFFPQTSHVETLALLQAGGLGSRG